MKSVLLSFVFALASAMLCSSLRAQEDFEEDRLADIEKRIESAERESRQLEAKLKDSLERLNLLKMARVLEREAAAHREKIEAARNAGQEEFAERFEEALEELELRLDRTHANLELLNEKREVRELVAAAAEEGLREIVADGSKLFEILNQRKKLQAELFKVYQDGPEAKESPLEEKLEALGETFEHRLEILGVRLDLYWAREEGEDEAVEELEAELRSLRREEQSESTKRDDLEPSDERKREDNDDPRLRPVQVTPEEIQAASKKASR